MPKTRQQKENLVQNISDKLNKAKAVVFADYKGLTMKQLSDLRDSLREQNAEFTITKNTLLDLALPDSRFPASRSEQIPDSRFTGPTATLFAYDDEISPIKTLVKALKDANLGKIKSGFLGDMSLDEAKINQLATLPSKQELKGQVVGILIAPLTGIVSVLQGNLRNLVYALNQIKIQKGGE